MGLVVPPEDILDTIEQHAVDAAAIAATIRARPDLIAYAHGMLHDMGALVPYEIAQILYACALQPAMFMHIRAALEYYAEHIPPTHYPEPVFD